MLLGNLMKQITLASKWLIPVQGPVVWVVIWTPNLRCHGSYDRMEIQKYLLQQRGSLSILVKTRVRNSRFTELCWVVSSEVFQGFLLLNIKIENSNSSVIKLWVKMKGFQSNAWSFPSNHSCSSTVCHTHVQVLPEVVCIPNVFYVRPHFVSMCRWHPAVL